MNAEELYRGILDMDDQYIEEAQETNLSRTRHGWKRYLAAAACLALMAAAAGLLLPPEQTEPVSLSQSTPQTIQQTAAPEVEQTPELTAEAQWPSIDECIYEHTDEGDFLTLIIHGADETASETIDITGQLADGKYVGRTHLAGIEEIIYLTVFEDGSYDVRFEGIPRAPQEIPGEADENGAQLVTDP